jgi:RNA polymerase sigma-70 factor (ECF subfamily)
MSGDSEFDDLMLRVRRGDPQAAAELVRTYEPVIRVAVRARLTDPALRRFLDTMDICQSVLASFFLRAAGGQYELDQPAQLIHLLETMARNKLVNQAKKLRAARRDCRRLDETRLEDLEAVAPGPNPSSVVCHQDLLHALRTRLSAAECQLMDQRTLGRQWTEIAAQFGGHPDTLRMQLTRALDRVSRELGLDD